MLTPDQIIHFERHGWVLQEKVFTTEQIAAFRLALDRQDAGFIPVGHSADDGPIRNIDAHIGRDPVFLEWIGNVALLEANRQLMGAELHHEGCHAMISSPHPDRLAKCRELKNPEHWGWHRGIRPKWGAHPHDIDPALHQYSFLNNITYLRDVNPGDGATAVLDGSHLSEGTYATLKDRFPVVELTAAAGSVLHFTETLIHTGVPITSERSRYAMFLGFTPPWYLAWPQSAGQKELGEQIRDPAIRRLFSPGSYAGQQVDMSLYSHG